MGLALTSFLGRCLLTESRLFRYLSGIFSIELALYSELKRYINVYGDVQEAYSDIASGLSEADGVDYSDPEEVLIIQKYTLKLVMWFQLQDLLIYILFFSEQLELLVATLIDLDAMDGKSSVSLLAECSSSPNVDTR